MTSPTASQHRDLFVGHASMYQNGTRVLRRTISTAGLPDFYATITVFPDYRGGCTVVTQSPRGLVVCCFHDSRDVSATVASLIKHGDVDVTPGGTV
jgi:hypothetical protein